MRSHHDGGKAMETTQYQYLAPKEFLDSIVHSGTDALMLGCIDKVGQITYRQAIAEQNARVLD
jgi:hypothetical protein